MTDFRSMAGHSGMVSASLWTALLLTLAAMVPTTSFAADPDVVTPPADAETLPSGLVSKVLQVGTGDFHPDANDLVAVYFTGYTPEGEIFKTTEPNKPATFPLNRVFAGWREGMGLMVQGEKRRLWIPDHLGPKNPQSGPAGAAIFDVELLAIKRVPNPPRSLKKASADAERLVTGVYTKLLDEGKGEETAGPDGRVLLEYTLWDDQGKTIESTSTRGRPTAFMLDRVMPAFAEAVQDMKVGERRYFWIPPAAHGGQWPNAPKGMMIFEVQVVRLLAQDALQLKSEGAPGS